MHLRSCYTYQTTQITIVFEGTYLQIILRIKIKYLQKREIAKTLKTKTCRLQNVPVLERDKCVRAKKWST